MQFLSVLGYSTNAAVPTGRSLQAFLQALAATSAPTGRSLQALLQALLQGRYDRRSHKRSCRRSPQGAATQRSPQAFLHPTGARYKALLQALLQALATCAPTGAGHRRWPHALPQELLQALATLSLLYMQTLLSRFI